MGVFCSGCNSEAMLVRTKGESQYYICNCKCKRVWVYEWYIPQNSTQSFRRTREVYANSKEYFMIVGDSFKQQWMEALYGK